MSSNNFKEACPRCGSSNIMHPTDKDGKTVTSRAWCLNCDIAWSTSSSTTTTKKETDK